ncbi:MAG: type II toxin-antitoxin system VapB family antitoxin [Nocardioidaceae bacterium]
MPDVLVRDFPADDLARLDARAARLGVSRNEYIRRRLRQDAHSGIEPVDVSHLARFAQTFSDLADDAVMSEAWR